MLQPRSRGNVTLKSADPYDKPLIYANYLCEKDDLNAIVDGIKVVQKIAQTDALKKVGTKPIPTTYYGCEHYNKDSDEYLQCQVRSWPQTIFHFSSTAKMGDPSDPYSVVDPNLKVKGVTNLRVVDSSVMPTIVSANTNAATIAIGERGADLILGRPQLEIPGLPLHAECYL